MTDLAQMIAKLEAASEGSRELDVDIAIASGEWTPPYGAERDADRPDVWRRSGVNYWAQYAAYTTSLDAIVALIARKLPGVAGWSVALDTYDNSAALTDMAGETRGAVAKTLPLAACIAFLRALQAQQETSEDE
ncbi:hypothetical protein [Phenylobacterium sp.]|uniref:hypothetical protein n=1 Tax=Phenylobacterium sp. TaxID=1871053 RepID=UPI0035B25FF9